MRELTLCEIGSVSGASNNLDIDFMAKTGITLLVTGYIAEFVFIGYCGYHIATMTGIVAPVIGPVLAIGSVVSALYSPKIYNHFTK